jgi:hypothetical protein
MSPPIEAELEVALVMVTSTLSLKDAETVAVVSGSSSHRPRRWTRWDREGHVHRDRAE